MTSQHASAFPGPTEPSWAEYALPADHQQRPDHFQVGHTFLVPDLADLAPAGGRLDTAWHHTDDIYFDTTDRDLRRLGVTLGRRVGGPDTGWRLSLSSDVSVSKISYPSRTRTVPAPVRDVLAGIHRGQELAPVLSVTTSTQVFQLVGPAGEVRAEVGDSQVIAAATKSASKRREIRQIQAKHGPDGDAELADTLRRRLVKAGATPAADYTSALLQSPGVWVDGSAADTLGGVLTAYLAEQHDALLRGDLGLRLDQPFITVTLSAVQRLQNALRNFTPLWVAREADTLDEELEWLAALLTEVADRQALEKRLVVQLAALPAPLVHGPVAARLESVLTAEQELHRSVLREAMHSNRYRQLLQRLASWRDAPPLTARAGKPGAAVKKYLTQIARQLDRRLSATAEVDRDGDGGALHAIRILGGQLEHAAEVGARALGPKAAKLVGKRRWSLDILDEHHRSGLSAEFLLRIGPVDADGEHSGFTYGLLYEQELRRAAGLRKQLAGGQG